MDESKVPKGERLGPSDIVGTFLTGGELIAGLSALPADLPIFSGRNNHRGISLHRQALIDPTDDYVSFTHLQDPDTPLDF